MVAGREVRNKEQATTKATAGPSTPAARTPPSLRMTLFFTYLDDTLHLLG
jgi:hypothetical protein